MTATDVRVQFQDEAQQQHAAELGMWVFLASEVLFFAGLFALYGGSAATFGRTFREAARHTDLTLGSINTCLLLTSSLCVAAATSTIRDESRRRMTLGLIGSAALLGALFLGLKIAEYAAHLREGLGPGPYYTSAALTGPGAHAFFNLYYTMTGVHAIHVGVGILLLLWIEWLTYTRRIGGAYVTPLELGGLFWHFIDVIWVFLWPLFYLIRG